MNLEVAMVIQEGFQHIHKCLEAVVEEVRAVHEEGSIERIHTDAAMRGLKEWAEGEPDANTRTEL